MGNYVHIKLFRDPQQSAGERKYAPKIEDAIAKLGLKEIVEATEPQGEGLCRRETGPEIVASIPSLVDLGASIMVLVNAWREQYGEGEVGIQITVSSSRELGGMLSALHRL